MKRTKMRRRTCWRRTLRSCYKNTQTRMMKRTSNSFTKTLEITTVSSMTLPSTHQKTANCSSIKSYLFLYLRKPCPRKPQSAWSTAWVWSTARSWNYLWLVSDRGKCYLLYFFGGGTYITIHHHLFLLLRLSRLRRFRFFSGLASAYSSGRTISVYCW